MGLADRVERIVKEGRSLGLRFDAVAISQRSAQLLAPLGQMPRRVLSQVDGPLLIIDPDLDGDAIELREATPMESP